MGVVIVKVVSIKMIVTQVPLTPKETVRRVVTRVYRSKKSDESRFREGIKVHKQCHRGPKTHGFRHNQKITLHYLTELNCRILLWVNS